jgi:hypothetical protein
MENYTLITIKVGVVIKWESIKDLSPTVFGRLTGVKDTTFIEIVAILQKAHDKKKQLGGRPNKLCIADMLLMTLEYLREYRTYLHIGKSYGVSERTIALVFDLFFTSLRYLDIVALFT